ncbi:MAG: replication factor C large subunit [Candidatus Micrarchaeia archaeon]
MLWCDKHRPKTLEQFAGNSEIVEEVKKWAFDWERGRKGKAILLHGPAGVGKSTLAYVLASSMGWPVVEMNASDLRDEESVRRVIGEASASSNLFGGKKLILIDEVDGLQKADRGGSKVILEIVRGAEQPVMLTANDIWKPSLATLRSACTNLAMRRVNSRTIASLLKKIAEKEGVKISEEIIAKIASNSSGDLRSAINDLQAIGEGGVGSPDVIGERDREKGMFDLVRAVLKAEGYEEARETIWNVDDRDMFVRWVEENIPLEYDDVGDVARAYDSLSRADIFDGRIIRRQHWGFLRYSNDLATAGVALAKKERYHKFVKYQFPKIISKLGSSRGERAMKANIGVKIGRMCHVSSKDAISIFFPVIKLLCKEKKNAENIQKYFGFDDEEMEYIGVKVKGKK